MYFFWIVGITQPAFSLGHYQSISETPLEWRFADGPIVVLYYMLTVIYEILMSVKHEELSGTLVEC